MLKLFICIIEQAQNFKEQGNDNFKSKKYKEAVTFYTQGLGKLAPELLEETKRTLWCNRAAAHLELGKPKIWCFNISQQVQIIDTLILQYHKAIMALVYGTVH